MRYKPDYKTGLNTNEVNERISHNLVNYDDQPPTKTVKEIFRDNFFTYFNFINSLSKNSISFDNLDLSFIQ